MFGGHVCQNKGITLGCTDTSHYCPSDTVNRLQMALFLQRAGKGNAANTLVDTTATIGGGGTNGTQLSLPTLGPVDCTNPPGGPCANRVTDVFGTIAGGVGNRAGDASGAIDSAAFATVGGGLSNTASGLAATVAGGESNTGSATDGTVGGGIGNTASGFEATTVGGGWGNTANGNYSTVPGGLNNKAQGAGSFAAGEFAIAGGDGSFAWADATGFIFDPSNGPGGWGSNRANTFSVRATGGVWFVTGIDITGHPVPGSGVEALPNSGAWSTYSDRNGKDNIEAVDSEAVLGKLVATPVATWRWKGEDERFRHMGPMAQDFYAAFHLGADDKHIVTVDAEGVALAAIQGLNAKLEERLAAKDQQLAAQEREIAELRERLTAVESLRGELAALRNAIATATRGAVVETQADATTR